MLLRCQANVILADDCRSCQDDRYELVITLRSSLSEPSFAIHNPADRPRTMLTVVSSLITQAKEFLASCYVVTRTCR